MEFPSNPSNWPKQQFWHFIRVDNEASWTRPAEQILIDLVREVRLMPTAKAWQLIHAIFGEELARDLIVRFMMAELYVSMKHTTMGQVEACSRREGWSIEANKPWEKAA